LGGSLTFECSFTFEEGRRGSPSAASPRSAATSIAGKLEVAAAEGCGVKIG
jgi:hypothetical protein